MRPTAMDVLKSGGVGVVGEDELNVKITPKCGRVTGTGGGGEMWDRRPGAVSHMEREEGRNACKHTPRLHPATLHDYKMITACSRP